MHYVVYMEEGRDRWWMSQVRKPYRVPIIWLFHMQPVHSWSWLFEIDASRVKLPSSTTNAHTPHTCLCHSNVSKQCKLNSVQRIIFTNRTRSFLYLMNMRCVGFRSSATKKIPIYSLDEWQRRQRFTYTRTAWTLTNWYKWIKITFKWKAEHCMNA